MNRLPFRRFLPWALAASRALLGPALVLCQAAGWNGLTLAAMVTAGLLSDIYDGVLARRWHTDTDALRTFDSMADIVFYLGAAWSLAHRCPALWLSHRLLVVAMVAMELERLALDIVRFRRPSAYHAYLSKLAGLLLSIAVVLCFALSGASPRLQLVASISLTLALAVGLLSQAEGFAMSLILPVWRRDLPSIVAALRIRRVLLKRVAKHLPRIEAPISPMKNGARA